MDEADDKLMNLEVKVAYLEHHLLTLDELVRTLNHELQQFRLELADLRDSLPEGEKAPNEPPPHY